MLSCLLNCMAATQADAKQVFSIVGAPLFNKVLLISSEGGD